MIDVIRSVIMVDLRPGTTDEQVAAFRDALAAVPFELHLDFRPDDRDAEVARLLGLGATRADVGQGEQSWVVLADPEGNEFCVLRLRSRPSAMD
jgi:hypothetical protein